MKLINSFLGLLVIAAGLLPFFRESYKGLGFLSSEPYYNGMIIIIGALILIVNLRDKRKMVRR